MVYGIYKISIIPTPKDGIDWKTGASYLKI